MNEFRSDLSFSSRSSVNLLSILCPSFDFGLLGGVVIRALDL